MRQRTVNRRCAPPKRFPNRQRSPTKARGLHHPQSRRDRYLHPHRSLRSRHRSLPRSRCRSRPSFPRSRRPPTVSGWAPIHHPTAKGPASNTLRWPVKGPPKGGEPAHRRRAISDTSLSRDSVGCARDGQAAARRNWQIRTKTSGPMTSSSRPPMECQHRGGLCSRRGSARGASIPPSRVASSRAPRVSEFGDGSSARRRQHGTFTIPYAYCVLETAHATVRMSRGERSTTGRVRRSEQNRLSRIESAVRVGK